jgi:toxin FitB
MYLLDTNVVSELRKTTRADVGVQAWSAKYPFTQFWLSTISLLELEIGILRVHRRDPTQSKRLRDWLESSLLPQFGTRILNIDSDIARRCAQLHVPDPRPERDALIAATALVHGLTVVSRNTADFQPLGVKLINPWTAQNAAL